MINTVGVIGLGTMGAGIVEVFAAAGITVIAVDGSEELAARGRGFVEKSTQRAVDRGRLSAEKQQEMLARITFTTGLQAMAPADLVIEAVPERLEIKTAVFTELDQIVCPDAILATNTSSLSLTTIGQKTAHPERVVGMHFFNPVPVLKLVEIIGGLQTSPAVKDAIVALTERIGKVAVMVEDRPGFVANALLIAYAARSIRAYEEGLASREDIDTAINVGVGLPMGPLTLCDLIGNDVVLEVCEVLFDAQRHPHLAPPSLLRNLVTAGHLGRKTGKGFYTYEKPGSGKVVDGVSDYPASGSQQVALIVDGIRNPAIDKLAQAITAAGHNAVVISNLSEIDRLQQPEIVIVVPGADEETAASSGVGAEHLAREYTEADLAAYMATGISPGETSTEDGSDELLERVFASIAPTTPVLCIGEEHQWVQTFDPKGENRVLPVVLHEPTRGGQLCEIGRTPFTSSAHLDAATGFAASLGWKPVVSKARAGLIVNQLLLPHINDAVNMIESGYAQAADIDNAMKYGCGYPAGPLELLDAMDLAEVIGDLEDMRQESAEACLLPSPLLYDHLLAERPFHS